MKIALKIALFLFAASVVYSCSKDEASQSAPDFDVLSVNVGIQLLSFTEVNTGLPTDRNIIIRFTAAMDTSTALQSIRLQSEQNETVAFSHSFMDNNKTITLVPTQSLTENTVYILSISSALKGESGQSFVATSVSFKTLVNPLQLVAFSIDGQTFYPGTRIQNIGLEPEIRMEFSHALTSENLLSNIQLKNDGTVQSLELTPSGGNTVFIAKPVLKLKGFVFNSFSISEQLSTQNGNPFDGFTRDFYTTVDSTPKFPLLSDEELLTLIQKQTFRYFWDFGHPVSGLARERNTSGETVTIGGSGFGLMSIIVGIERGFITREEGIQRLHTIVDFLGQADRFHGAWSHWLNGTTGEVRPFSQKDNGGDLVETSYMAAGLLAVRQYLDSNDSNENDLISKINDLWNSIEWNWYTQGGQNVLYWHWSPNYGWDMNMKIQGYNEALITYIMAASSTTHGISADVYHLGWARNGGIINGKEFYDITLPVGYDYGGPLFFAHYSFLGIDPRNLSDQYANYWEQNRNHSLINHAYCTDNPNQFVGYSNDCWGLTASDNQDGYSAHSPTNDLGVISPTAAVSSIPYTPEESMDAIRFFYYTLGDRLWGEYGFYDAFNVTESWTASSFLAIDQGPMIVMIENYRSGLIWDLLMSSPEVQAGLTKLGFTY